MITHFNHNPNEKTSVLFWLRKNKPSRKTGLFPIYCRLTIGTVRANDFSTGVQVMPEYWESKTQTILPANSKEAEQTELNNDFLRRCKLDLQKIVATFELAGNEYTPQEVVDFYLQKPQRTHYTLKDLIKVWEDRLQQQVDLGEKALGTKRIHELYHEFITSYFGEKKPLNTFVTSDYEDLRLYIRSQKVKRGATKGKNTSQNYTAKILAHLKRLFVLARQSKWIKENPFKEETVTTTKGVKTFLATDKLEKIHTETWDTDTQVAVDIFLFMAYTGLNYGDYETLTQENLVMHEGRQFIHIPYRDKSPIADRYGESNMPILPEVQTLIDKYGGIGNLPKDESAGKKLKYVWGRIGAPKGMQLRHARHTFINYARTELGLKESTIALIVGHSDVRTTEEHYLMRDINTLFMDLQRAKV